MQALYRKYRSKTLSEVVGQEHITDTLARALKNGRISHAYLFTGPRGVGKTSVARILAHEINGLPYGEANHLDIIEIDAASNRRIDDIRDLRDKVHIAPTSAKYKVYIIDEVHMLTAESFNALLKTLEEPPEHVVFILATTEVNKLPATIISRVQRYSFRPVVSAKVVGHLKHIAEQEGIAIDNEALELIAEHGEGSFRDSISLLDQLANTTGEAITSAIVEQNLGLAPRALVLQLIADLQHADAQAILALLDILTAQGVTSTTLLPQLLRSLQHAASQDARLFNLIDKLLDVPRSYNPDVKLLTALLGFLPSTETRQSLNLSSIQPQVEALAGEQEPVIVIKEKPVEAVKSDSDAFTSHQPSAQTAPQPTENTDAERFSSPPPATQLFSEAMWKKVLVAMKTASPPLASVLRACTPNYDESAGHLTLHCRYALHRKRIDEVKAKALIAKIFTEIGGTAPIITTELDKTPRSDVRSEETAPTQLDSAAQAVADIMGGGVPVHHSI